jgi:uncharacterized protein (TIGR03437 family)
MLRGSVRRVNWRLLYCGLLCIANAIQLGSQSTTATVNITSVPKWGQDGQIEGYVYGVDGSQVKLYLFRFIPDIGWFSLPDCNPIQVQGTGKFSVNAAPSIMDRYATRFSAYLVPASLAVPCSNQTATIPFVIEHNALSRASLPRLSQYQTISFGGLEWFVKTAPVQVYPGPQFFVQENAWVDALGQLHLRLNQCSGSWCAAEVFTKQALGYGTYRFTINSPLNNLDPNVTFGMFTWDGQAGDQYNREWDIEFGRWGDAGNSSNAQYVVQPYNGPGNLTRFLMSPSAPSTHTVTWSPSQVSFVSASGSGPLGSSIGQWTYNAGVLPVPTPGDVHLHLNLYVAVGQAPKTPGGQEIVISALQYTPGGPQIGFSRVADNVPFMTGSFATPLTATGAACTARVESDSPWLSVVGENPVLAGGTLQYAVSDNLGDARTGNLILTSTTCNPTLGNQVLTINQAGLICNPTFASDSTHVGFLQTVRSVIIRGTASACSWSVTSMAPWLRIVSPASGSGDGSVQFSTDVNNVEELRQTRLLLNNGQQHFVYQDGSTSFLALSPSVAIPCGNERARFAATWVVPAGEVEIHLNSPSGPLLGRFGPIGSTMLPEFSDGTVVYLVRPAVTGPGAVLASTRATVLPANCSASAIAPQGIVNAASFSGVSLAPGSLASVFGGKLSAAVAEMPGGTFSTSLGGARVKLGGEECPLSYVSPAQINFLVPADLPPGRHLLSVGAADSEVIITNVSPGFFTLRGDGTGVPLAAVTALLSDGTQITLPAYQCGSTGCGVVPIAVPENAAELYIVLYGTGIRNQKNVSAVVGPKPAEVLYVGAQSQFPGLDQVNLRVKDTAGLRGQQSVRLTADGFSSNSVELLFRE